MKIFEGKIIDVIRTKKPKDQRSISQMITSLEIDFAIELHHQNNYKAVDHIYYSSTLKHLLQRERKEIYQLLEKFTQSYIASTSFHVEDNLMQDILQTLQTRYHLDRLPYHMECVDISHLSGSYISG